MLPGDPEMCGQSVSRESQIQLWLGKIIGTMVSAGRGTRKGKKNPKQPEPLKIQQQTKPPKN